MDIRLGKEIASFAKEAKRLRKILYDTKKCFADINVTGNATVCILLFCCSARRGTCHVKNMRS